LSKAAARRAAEDWVNLELLCALLTGLFLWLLIYHWRWKSLARMRQVAGNHIFTAKSTVTRTLRWTFFTFVSLAFLAQLIEAVSRPHLVLGSEFSLAGLFALLLLLGIPRTPNIALEVRDRGVLFGVGVNYRSREGLQLTPWSQISLCQWVPKPLAALSRFEGAPNCLTVGRDAILPDQKADVTAALGRFVPVYDQDGALLAEPDEPRHGATVSWRDLDGPRFQFDLQTMLLLVVVVASAASLFGVHYRSPYYQAIRKIEAFGPSMFSFNDEVRGLDFSACVNKPTDDDLVYLEPLTELQHLDLAGSPITDAGLVHLRRLDSLRYVTLANTFVTPQAMKDLQEAMPGLSVGAIRNPPVPNPVAVPSPKDKRHP
jgi:hypothetical protein